MEFIHFEDYNATEIGEILQKRCKKGLKQFSQGVIEYIASQDMQRFSSDVRVGLAATLHVLRGNGELEATDEVMDRIDSHMTESHVTNINSILRNLNERNLSLIALIGNAADDERKRMSDQIYVAFKRTIRGGVSRPQFHRYLDHLERMGLIITDRVRVNRQTVKDVRLNLEEENIEFVKQLLEKAEM